MKRNLILSALALAAAFMAVGAGPSRAGVAWNGRVNGFGNGSISYTITCSNGQVIRRTTTAQPGSDACNDGSNDLTWSWGFFWAWDTRENEKKDVGADTHANVSANLVGGGNTMVLNGTFDGTGSNVSQLAVLKVTGTNIPTDCVLSLDELLERGVITPGDIAFRRDYSNTFNDSYLNQNIPLGGTYNSGNVIIFTYSRSGNFVPGAGPVGIGLVMALLALAGGFVIVRNRRGAAAA
jgi:hypothetical protein